jgi:hypothetical protein
MTRPAHIAPLDDAITKALIRYDRAELDVQRFYDQHIATIDALEEEKREAISARSEAYYAVKECEIAIRKLGFVVLNAIGKDERGKDNSNLGDRTFSTGGDMEAARKRALNRDDLL